jgi:hypothetical protein
MYGAIKNNNTKTEKWLVGIVVIATTSGKEDRGFESRPGMYRVCKSSVL